MSVKIIQDFIPINHYHRDGVKLRVFKGVTIHTTANYAKGADAKAHRNLAFNMCIKGNLWEKKYIGYHYFVDDTIAYQVTPSDERVWCCTDGANGIGNNETVSIEMCVHQGCDLSKAMDNVAYVTAYELVQHGVQSVVDGVADKVNGNVFQHNTWYPVKNCPDYIRNKGLWNEFIGLVKKHFNSLSKTQTQYYKINVEFNDGKWSSTQKGAFPYSDYGLAEAIKFYNDGGFGEEYKIFAPDGIIVYPKYQNDNSEKLEQEIHNLKDDIEVYQGKCKEYQGTIKEYENIIGQIVELTNRIGGGIVGK